MKLSATLIYYFIFRILLDVSFVLFVSPEFEYLGNPLKLSGIKIIESYVVLSVALLLLNTDGQKLSDILVKLFFFMSFIPISSIYGLSDLSREWFYLCFTFWIIILQLCRMKWEFSLPPLSGNGHKYSLLGSIVAVALVCATLFYQVDFDLNFGLDQDTVYGTRSKYRDLDLPMFGYLASWTAKILLPFLALASLFYDRKKVSWISFFIVIACTLLVFQTTGQKGYLFFVAMAIGSAFLIQTNNFVETFTKLINLIVAGGLILYLTTGHVLFASLFTRRLFFVPAKLTYYYHDFYDGNPVLLAHSILSPMFTYNYAKDPSQIIGTQYFAKPTNANTGMMADGFMNFGVIGVIMWAIIIVVLLKTSDALSVGRNRLVAWPLLICGLFSLLNGGLFTVLLTHGALLAFFLVYLQPKDRGITT